jgi:hypothetical protein
VRAVGVAKSVELGVFPRQGSPIKARPTPANGPLHANPQRTSAFASALTTHRGFQRFADEVSALAKALLNPAKIIGEVEQIMPCRSRPTASKPPTRPGSRLAPAGVAHRPQLKSAHPPGRVGQWVRLA